MCVGPINGYDSWKLASPYEKDDPERQDFGPNFEPLNDDDEDWDDYDEDLDDEEEDDDYDEEEDLWHRPGDPVPKDLT